ncbi:MAG TPA: nicotinate-nucleotide adenylyltransferase [Rhodocyclaceae bacterium]|jgi:nicotinate-nucleotide adenylyltransferase|nr:nicotinate-nucleotide adenylyltransferase [Rhodocyclaceae bacterium]HRQ45622.1 nicotinate-nucleotide adenylyltransferase [Rhodocyclaceae bacterium]
MNASTTETEPLGLLGGTFDPIHVGHLRLAEEARDALQLSGVRFIPAGDPPHRDRPICSAMHRLELVRRAVIGNPAFSVDDSEILNEGKSYTVVTLERLRASLGPTRPLVLILGADAFQGLPGWHRWTELIDLAHIAIANRPGIAPHGRRWSGALSDELDRALGERMSVDPGLLRQTPAGRVVPFDMTPLAISASLVRDLVASGHSARYLLPDSVLDYIARHNLYR